MNCKRFDEFVFNKSRQLESLKSFQGIIDAFQEAAARSRVEDQVCCEERRKRALCFKPNVIGLKEYVEATTRLKAAFERGQAAKREAQDHWRSLLNRISMASFQLSESSDDLEEIIFADGRSFEEEIAIQEGLFNTMVEASSRLSKSTSAHIDMEREVEVGTSPQAAKEEARIDMAENTKVEKLSDSVKDFIEACAAFNIFNNNSSGLHV